MALLEGIDEQEGRYSAMHLFLNRFTGLAILCGLGAFNVDERSSRGHFMIFFILINVYTCF